MTKNHKGWGPGEMEAAHRIGLVFAKRPWPGFAASVQEYKQIEAEILQSYPYDDYMVLELRRRIAEWIVKSAWRDEVPFELFQEAWNGLLTVGFTDAEKMIEMVFFYADYCLDHEHYDEGLNVIEPIIVEFESWLQTASLKPKLKKFFEDYLERTKFLRDGLIALRAGGEQADAWLELEEARGPSARELRKQELSSALFKARKDVAASLSSQGFTEIEKAYRQVEADFLSQLQPDDEFFVAEAKYQINADIFIAAHEHHQPFNVCRELWNQFEPWDFGHLEHKCPMIQRYAECCLFHGQSAAGLAVVEPLLAQLQRDVDAGTDEDMPSERYPKEIAKFQKLQNELKAIGQ